MVAASVLDLIGGTPLVDVSSLSPNPQVQIWAKLESANPFGSVKDRVAKAVIQTAVADGTLQPGQTILEPSSGNTGIALAGIGRMLGHRVVIVLPESVSVERRAALEAFGAVIVLTPGQQGSNGSVRRALELADQHPDWFMPFQYGNDANPTAHYTGTGPEIWAQTKGTVTHFVAGLGTSGTLTGVGRYLKEQNPAVKVFAVEPPAGELVEGLRSLDDGFIPPVFERWGGAALLDGKRIIRPTESIIWTRRLLDLGVFAGPSSGAALAGAVRVAERLNQGVIVFIVCDAGWKYLSTSVYAGDIDLTADTLNKIIYF